MSRRVTALLILLLCSAGSAAAQSVEPQPGIPELQETATQSSLDGEQQPVRYWAPETAATQATPLFVFLHSWSGDYTQDNSRWLRLAVEQGWIFLHPNFRGINNSPKACGSRFARRDILDAIAWASKEFNVDANRVYLAGVSGGGHMAMLMAGHHPEHFTAVSAWVGISDLSEWHRFHVKDGQPDRYAEMIVASLGGPPGTSEMIDAEYRDRSPIFHIRKSGDLPIHIYAGVEDGHSGSVPVRHSLEAFNQIALAHQQPQVTEEEMQQLWVEKRLLKPGPSDVESAKLGDRDILLRRHAGPSTVTIFQGGHESLPDSAVRWLQQFQRPVKGVYAKP
ncbi:MAG: prolyl oligopeptidase family serine peptidase [Planctomyces sp.]|nr:prolyl oligopeptidase family serine peptidase [Planctomyces sp.]